MIPHGIPDLQLSPTAAFKRAWGFGDRFVVSTFGLLSRGKGLETALDAIADVAKAVPEVLYLILGATHPLVARREGESYREELQAEIRSLQIDGNVLMVDRYLTISDLLLYLAASDAYVTPYTNPNQIVSGTLAYAVGSGRPVLSTPYLYARELLSESRGIIVPFGDAGAMATAIIKLASDEGYRLGMARRAHELGRAMTWPVVGKAYAQLVSELCSTGVKAARSAS